MNYIPVISFMATSYFNLHSTLVFLLKITLCALFQSSCISSDTELLHFQPSSPLQSD